MLILDQLTRLSVERIHCHVTHDGHIWEFTVRFETVLNGIDCLSIEGERRDEAFWKLYNSIEYRAMMQTLFKYQHGDAVTLPLEIISDYPAISASDT